MDLRGAYYTNWIHGDMKIILRQNLNCAICLTIKNMGKHACSDYSDDIPMTVSKEIVTAIA